jgi:hypothetical protein
VSGRIYVYFSCSELKFLQKHAKARHKKKRKYGVVNTRVDTTRDDFAIDLLGVKAEYGCDKVFSCGYNQLTGLKGDGGKYDGIIRNKTIQIKSTFHSGGHLIFKPPFGLKADLAILCTEDSSDSIVIAGWTTRREWREKAKFRTFQKTQLSMSQGELRPAIELYKLLKRIEAKSKQDLTSRFGSSIMVTKANGISTIL